MGIIRTFESSEILRHTDWYRRRQQAFPKRSYLHTNPHGIMSKDLNLYQHCWQNLKSGRFYSSWQPPHLNCCHHYCLYMTQKEDSGLEPFAGITSASTWPHTGQLYPCKLISCRNKATFPLSWAEQWLVSWVGRCQQ